MRMMVAGGLLVPAILAVMGGDARAQAVNPPPADVIAVPLQRPWVVSYQMNFNVYGEPSYATAGVGVERTINRFFRVDADIGRGLSSAVATSNGLYHTDPALDLGARARATLPFGRREINAAFLGLGPHFSAGGLYGNLWQAHVEIGYSLRTPFGLSFLYAVGKEFALQEKAAPFDPAICVNPSCPGALHGGDTITVIRGALGYAF